MTVQQATTERWGSATLAAALATACSRQQASQRAAARSTMARVAATTAGRQNMEQLTQAEACVVQPTHSTAWLMESAWTSDLASILQPSTSE